MADDCVGRNVTNRHDADSYNGRRSNIDASTNRGARAHPRAPSNAYRLHDEIKTFAAIIMIPAQKQRSLRETRTLSDRNVIQAIYPNPLPYPGVVTNRQTPGIFDVDARLDHDTSPNRSSKQSQQHALGCGKRHEPRVKANSIHAIPDRANDGTMAWVVPRVTKGFQTDENRLFVLQWGLVFLY